MANLKELKYLEPDLGDLTKFPDYLGKNILVVGVDSASGFGRTIGRALYERRANVIGTVFDEKSFKDITEKNADKNTIHDTFDLQTLDITKEEQLEKLSEYVKNNYSGIDAVIYTPAFVDRKYLDLGIKWDDIPKEKQDECLDITVNGLDKVTDALYDSLKSSKGTLYGVSFPVHDFPAYSIGEAKKQLEDKCTGELAERIQEDGVKSNVLLLGPFESLSSLPMNSQRPLIEQMFRELLDREPPENAVADYAKLALAAMAKPQTGQKIYADLGFYDAIQNNPKKTQRLYDEFIQARLTDKKNKNNNSIATLIEKWKIGNESNSLINKKSIGEIGMDFS